MSECARAAKRQTPNALYLFAALQLIDFATTMAAFRLGGREENSLVSSLFPLLGPVTAVLACKLLLIAVGFAAVAFRKVRAVRLANFVYIAIVAWNLHIIVRLIGRTV